MPKGASEERRIAGARRPMADEASKAGTGNMAGDTNPAGRKVGPETNDATNDGTNDAKGTMPGDRGDAKAQPSGYRGENPATAGHGETEVTSNTPEKAEGQLNPSAPGNTGTTPGTTAKVG
jgi:hypothetical protein